MFLWRTWYAAALALGCSFVMAACLLRGASDAAGFFFVPAVVAFAVYVRGEPQEW